MLFNKIIELDYLLMLNLKERLTDINLNFFFVQNKNDLQQRSF